MQREGVDAQMQKAKSSFLSDAYMSAVRSGRPDVASGILAQLSNVDKNAAATLMSQMPSYKNIWDFNNDVAKARQANQWKIDADARRLKSDMAKISAQSKAKIQTLAAKGQMEASLAMLRSELKTREKQADFENTVNNLRAMGASDQQIVGYFTSGKRGNSNGANATGSNSDRRKALAEYLKLYKDDPTVNQSSEYRQRQEEYNSYTAPQYNFADYGSNMEFATDLLEATNSDGSPRYTKSEIINTLRYKTDMADNIISNIDWKAWGRE